MARDPVCGMKVDEQEAPAKSDYAGETHYFCCVACKKAFDLNLVERVEGSDVVSISEHEYKDLIDMTEIINNAIEINAREEEFYRRSAATSIGDVAKILFLEIADDVEESLDRLRARRQKLWDALSGLRAAESGKKVNL